MFTVGQLGGSQDDASRRHVHRWNFHHRYGASLPSIIYLELTVCRFRYHIVYRMLSCSIILYFIITYSHMILFMLSSSSRKRRVVECDPELLPTSRNAAQIRRFNAVEISSQIPHVRAGW